MKKYNIQNYIRYKTDRENSLSRIEGKMWDEYSRDELIINFLPLVETIARKFSTSDQASGVLSINDLIQEGSFGLVAAIDKLDWNIVMDSSDPESRIKAFISKRIKGAIRRAIDINRGSIKIPEHKLIEIRKNNGQDRKITEMFFNSVFESTDALAANSEDNIFEIEDTREVYNTSMLNTYLLSIMNKYLTKREYDIVRMSYGLDCDKHSAKDIANKLGMTMESGFVRVSQIKKEAIDKLIDSVPPEQVLDYL